MSVRPAEGIFVTVQLEPTKACEVGRMVIIDAKMAKELENFMTIKLFDVELQVLRLFLAFCLRLCLVPFKTI